MKFTQSLLAALPPLRGWLRNLLSRGPLRRPLGLKTKTTLFIILNVASVLLVFSYLDYHLAQKDQIDLYLDRNLYIAKQIDIGIPDPRITGNLPRVGEEMEEWLLSRPSLMEIDLFLFSPKGWKPVVSTSKLSNHRTDFAPVEDQIKSLKKDRPLSSLRVMEDEQWLEVIVPFHQGKKVIGGIRVASSLDEAQQYLNKKRNRALILTLSSILIIPVTLTFLFRKLVGNPIQQLVRAMTRAEKGDLEAEAQIQNRDELGELGRNFNQMLKTIREAHTQNVQLLSQVNQFNEELTRKIREATSELAERNEELQLLNEALFESQRQLGQAEKLAALGQVAATMAHQIGTPLNSISGYLQLMLQDGNLQPKDQERLKIIESQLDRLADSIRNLLAFTRQPKARLKALDVNEVLEELIHLSEPWFLPRNVRLSTHFSPDLPHIMGDPMHLQTLFLNLITNALDAMPQGGTLTIKTQGSPSPASTEKKGGVEISIADTGIGISEDAKKKIFEPFFTTKKLGEGTGLGLAICSQIIKEHLGKLEVESQVGKGSTLFVYIPGLTGSESYESFSSPALGRG